MRTFSEEKDRKEGREEGGREGGGGHNHRRHQSGFSVASNKKLLIKPKMILFRDTG